MQRLIFTEHSAGFGTTAGVRLVVGRWTRSPFGAFTDVMVQTDTDERSRHITAATGSFDAGDLGAVAPLLPAVGFGFSSAPPVPQIVAVTTTIDVPMSAAG